MHQVKCVTAAGPVFMARFETIADATHFAEHQLCETVVLEDTQHQRRLDKDAHAYQGMCDPIVLAAFEGRD